MMMSINAARENHTCRRRFRQTTTTNPLGRTHEVHDVEGKRLPDNITVRRLHPEARMRTRIRYSRLARTRSADPGFS